MRIFAKSLVLLFLACACSSARAAYIQQGNKLVGTGAVGNANQGVSVAISGDGTTAIIGGRFDNGNTGAAWVFVQSGGVWTQQGGKLVGTGGSGTTFQGISVALSADGNTAIIGGNNGGANTGAAWIFTRSGGVWTQQGSKLVGTGFVGPSVGQGTSVALSGDGKTALIGGANDNNQAGAAWVFTFSGGVWSQFGSKLVGTGAVGIQVQQGRSVALSQDGQTALIGGPGDGALSIGASGPGAAWVFKLNGGVYSQVGSKLNGTGSSANTANQGVAVALSADGNTALIGGPDDAFDKGAAWVFVQNGGVYTQLGSKLVGTGGVLFSRQGFSVALSGDGKTAMLAGDKDNSNVGAVWVFKQSGGVFTQDGAKLVGSGNVGQSFQGKVALSTDGSTAIIGGGNDNSGIGAAWIFAAPPLVITDFSNDQNPSLINQTVNFSFTATDTTAPTIDYSINFGDSSAPVTGTFVQGTTVNLAHLYSQYYDSGIPVTLMLSDGTHQATQTLTQIVPSPASGAENVTNLALGGSPISAPLATPLGGLSVAVGYSAGGVIQMAINVDALTRSNYRVNTDFSDLQGRSSTGIVGLTPVHKYLSHGIFVAKSTATNVATQQAAGKARITLAISSKETAETVAGQNAAQITPAAIPDSSTLTTKTLKAKFAFNGLKPDTVSYTGTVPLQAGFDPSKSHEVWFGIGNIVVVTMVDPKGKGTVPGDPAVLKSLKFTTKLKKGTVAAGGELATITVTYSTSKMVANGFDTEGIDAQSTDLIKGKAIRNIQIAMVVDGVPYQALKPVDFSVTGKSDFGNLSARK